MSDAASSTRSGKLVGRETPRLLTEPLRPLTQRTTLGYECIEFATEILGIDLMPWQKYWLLHALEVDNNGDFRYRQIVTLVGRQSGKTTLLKVVALWMMYMGRVKMVLSAAQSLDIAREAWQGAVDMAQGDPELRAEIAGIRRTNGEQEMRLDNNARYKISAATRDAGRGLSVDLLLLDELRAQRTWDAWGALANTVMARPNALTLCFSNAGDDTSVVLNHLRSVALSGTDQRLGLLEWSAPDGCDLDDREGWAQGSPGLGYTITESAVASQMASSPPNTFRTELLCQRVDVLDSALDIGGWKAGRDATLTLTSLRDRTVACFDASPDGTHATLVAAAADDDGRVRAKVVGSWATIDLARRDLPDLLSQLGPVAVAWYPGGPANALAPELKGGAFASRLGDVPPVELRGAEAVASCMTLAELVSSRRLLHPGDPLLDAQAAGASKLPQGDGFRFMRRGPGHVDSVYALAGACYLALAHAVAEPAPWFGVVS